MPRPVDPNNLSPIYLDPQTDDVSAEPAGKGDADEAADYIAGSAADLAALARRHSLKTLGYLLDMVQLEAEEHARLRLLRGLK